MVKIAIIGAGRITKPVVDYFIDTWCGFQVILVNRTLAHAQKIIAGIPLGKAVQWDGTPAVLDDVVGNADIVICTVPESLHPEVAQSCLRNRKNMVTTAYETPELKAMDTDARARGIMILNELGVVPGLDHFGTQMLLDEIRNEDGEIRDVYAYGGDLPSFRHNTNPMRCKFSPNPAAVLTPARTGATYYVKGKRVDVPGENRLRDFRLVDLDGLGTFETYPHSRCNNYLKPLGLDMAEDITFYRGVLKYTGYCNTLGNIERLGFPARGEKENYTGKTYRQLLASLIGAESTTALERKTAEYLGVHDNADIIHSLKWLGLFDDRAIDMEEGTPADVLMDRMVKKMTYQPHEYDMIVIHIDVTAEFPGNRRQKRTASMVIEGTPYRDFAMPRTAGLPVAIAARLVLNGTIKGTGLCMPPNLPGLYPPVLKELENFGYYFKRKIMEIPAPANSKNKKGDGHEWAFTDKGKAADLTHILGYGPTGLRAYRQVSN